MHPFDTSQSLEQLENDVWPHQSYPTYVVQESQRLRKLPVGELDAEGLRLLIGQRIGLEYVVPLALEKVEANPLVQGRNYSGDLLVGLLGVPAEFWCKQPELNEAMVSLRFWLEQVHELFERQVLPALERFPYR